ncbi:MAG: DUF2188 domain-containing protein [Allisonella histaminiformans]|uniref:DUF2188 domain-containing protein n=1 Tax=Allisonella histaminiformans TaxID=209880 RepID=UPI002A7F7F70|nr:DUF2188 domain-containing protein [Allisonella histaminiformans]MDY3957417.1 DUF2188 domain-containing protein [Allisonella histaminiformans]MDY4540307.1 DUF2188 domain-containing protein [Allisonella histaminiformans]
MKKSQHVVPHNNAWAVRKSGSSKVTKTFKTQTGAIKFAKSIAKNQKTELLIHNRQGKIRSKDSYGNDPCPPKDTEH